MILRAKKLGDHIIRYDPIRLNAREWNDDLQDGIDFEESLMLREARHRLVIIRKKSANRHKSREEQIKQALLLIKAIAKK